MLPVRSYTPEGLLHVAWHSKWLIAIPFVLVALGTAVWSRTLPNRYRSETLIVVVPPRVPESYVRSTITEKIDARLPAITQQILSRTRLERIIQEFGLYLDDRKTRLMEEIVTRMRTDDITVEVVKGDAFQVSYVSTDARTAMKVTERLGAMFIEENLRDREVLAEGANQFLESQLDDARRRLLETEKTLEQYREQNSAELPSQLQSNLQVIQNAQTQLQALDESINRDRDRRLLIERTMADLTAGELASVASSGDPAGAGASVSTAARLDAARKALQAAETRLKPDHPDIGQLKRTIRDLEKAIEEEAGLSPSRSAAAMTPAESARQNRLRDLRAQMDDIDAQVNRKEASKRRVEASVTEYQRRVDAAPRRESEMIALSRDYETLNKIYTDLLGKREASNVAANLERRQIGEQFKVIDPARVPEKPFSPNRTRFNLLGAAAGLALGLGLVFFLELRDTSLKTEAEVTALLALPVLATIPMMLTTSEERAQKRKTILLACTGVAGFVLMAATAVAWRMHMLQPWTNQILQRLR